MPEGYHRENSTESIGNLLEDLSVTHDKSARRLHDHATGKTPGRVIGLTYADGKLFVEGDPRNLTGPISASGDYFLTGEKFSVELASGSPVSSQIWLLWDKRNHSFLQADISGAWAHIKKP